VFSPDLFKDRVNIEEKELQTWFEKNREDYRVDEKRTVSYLIIDPRDFQDKVQITDKEIEEYHKFNENKYYNEPQVKASHILIKLPPNVKQEENEAAKKKIEEIRSQILSGEDFSKLAEEHSEDDATKKKGGDLGFFSKGRMVPDFEEVAFKLQPGEISEPIKTRYGFHLIKVTDKKEGGTPPFDELKDKIKGEMTLEKEKEMAEDIIDQIYAELLEKPDIEAVAAKYSLEVKSSSPQTKKEIRNREEAEALFNMKTGRIAGVFRLGNKLKIDKLEEIVPSRIPDFAEIQYEVKEDFLLEKASEIAEQEAQAVLKKLRDGSQTLEKLAKTYETEVKETKDFNRRGYIPGLGKPDDPVYPLFNLKVDEYSEPFHKKDDVVLFQIKEIKKIDETQYKNDRSQLIGNILASKKEEMFNAWLTSRKKSAQVQENPDFFN
jgi:peptidyl-prolyl cis-trans isomerase D